ncbi:MAG: ATP-binding protein [Deltaproteobacteria bacterium]|nr:ATP-binding protein [Deltaproteobacteria bacterium]
MERLALAYLKHWKTRNLRKPLVIRGARQVGKSTLVQLFGSASFENLVVLNFERDPELAQLFASKSPQKIVTLLELHLNVPIQPGKTLLFLDEIQSAPAVMSSLRYFHEELPELHLIAAGSLLEIALEQSSTPMPVGRIEYLHLGPMQFEEFLLAAGHGRLVAFLSTFSVNDTIPRPVHNQLLALLREFMVTGGMPEAVKAFVDTGSHRECDTIKQSILSTFQDDFTKYGPRTNHPKLIKVYKALPRLSCSRFKYAHVDQHERAKDLSGALHLLCLARVAHRVVHTSCNGLPLGAEVNDRKFKVLFLDLGLMMRALGLTLLDLQQTNNPSWVNQGALCEQLVGQHLLYSQEFYQEPELHFWVREKRNAAAEVDFVIAEGATPFPVEVKAGKTGTLKSLHLFLQEKALSFGVRFNSASPSLLQTTSRTPQGKDHPFTLLSLPLYLVGQLRRLAREVDGNLG